MPIDRTSPMPLWAQIADDLRHRIESGEFDDEFPTDLDLVERYGVSRHTVRDALRRLRDEGLIVRQRGRGTTVQPSVIAQPTGALYSFFETIEAQGIEQVSRILALDSRTDAAAADELGVAADTGLVYLERIRCAGAEPIAHDRTWLPADLAAPILGCDFTHTSLYGELDRRCGRRPESGSETISPQLLDRADAGLLDAPEGIPAFRIERRTQSGGDALEWRVTTIRGDRYNFVANWRLGGSYEPQLVDTGDASDNPPTERSRA